MYKSQGMTLGQDELQLEDAFNYGQAYVALSWLTSVEGTWVRGGEITEKVVKVYLDMTWFFRDMEGEAVKVVVGIGCGGGEKGGGDDGGETNFT